MTTRDMIIVAVLVLAVLTLLLQVFGVFDAKKKTPTAVHELFAENIGDIASKSWAEQKQDGHHKLVEHSKNWLGRTFTYVHYSLEPNHSGRLLIVTIRPHPDYTWVFGRPVIIDGITYHPMQKEDGSFTFDVPCHR